MTRRRILVHGRVQGVGFRWACADEATRLGVTGWVRNRDDGAVEVAAEGDAAAVATLEAWLAHGPRFARVTRVDAADEPEEGAPSFEVRG